MHGYPCPLIKITYQTNVQYILHILYLQTYLFNILMYLPLIPADLCVQYHNISTIDSYRFTCSMSRPFPMFILPYSSSVRWGKSSLVPVGRRPTGCRTYKCHRHSDMYDTLICRNNINNVAFKVPMAINSYKCQTWVSVSL